VNRQLYGGWCLGKCKPGVIPDEEGLVEAVGKSIEILGVGFCGSVRVGSCEGASLSGLDLCDEAFREEVVGVGEGGSSYVGQGGGYALCEGVGCGVGSGSKEMSRHQRHGQWGFYLSGSLSGNRGGRGPFRLSLF